MIPIREEKEDDGPSSPLTPTPSMDKDKGKSNRLSDYAALPFTPAVGEGSTQSHTNPFVKREGPKTFNLDEGLLSNPTGTTSAAAQDVTKADLNSTMLQELKMTMKAMQASLAALTVQQEPARKTSVTFSSQRAYEPRLPESFDPGLQRDDYLPSTDRSYERSTTLDSSRRRSTRTHDGYVASETEDDTDTDTRRSNTKLKVESLPKYDGTRGEGLESFLNQVEAIASYKRRNWQDELLPILPRLMTDKATTWMTGMGKQGMKALKTWQDWQDELRKEFQVSNPRRKYWKKHKDRELKFNETFEQYFMDKRRLQQIVFHDDLPLDYLIDDILCGTPPNMRVLVETRQHEWTNLPDLKRTLNEMEKGLRPHVKIQDERDSDRGKVRFNKTPERDAREGRARPDKPKTPCPNCQGWHWKVDCPRNATRDSQDQRPPFKEGLTTRLDPTATDLTQCRTLMAVSTTEATTTARGHPSTMVQQRRT